jgi:hypothetical protein
MSDVPSPIEAEAEMSRASAGAGNGPSTELISFAIGDEQYGVDIMARVASGCGSDCLSGHAVQAAA